MHSYEFLWSSCVWCPGTEDTKTVAVCITGTVHQASCLSISKSVWRWFITCTSRRTSIKTEGWIIDLIFLKQLMSCLFRLQYDHPCGHLSIWCMVTDQRRTYSLMVCIEHHLPTLTVFINTCLLSHNLSHDNCLNVYNSSIGFWIKWGIIVIAHCHYMD